MEVCAITVLKFKKKGSFNCTFLCNLHEHYLNLGKYSIRNIQMMRQNISCCSLDLASDDIMCIRMHHPTFRMMNTLCFVVSAVEY